MNTKLERTHKMLETPKTSEKRMYFHPILMMHAAKLYGKTYSDFMLDYHVLVESNLKLLEMYDHDAVSVISDPSRELSAFGANVVFEGDNSPKWEPIIHDMDDVERLQIPDVYACERTLDRINGVKLFREKLGNPFPIIGWIEGPLAEAADLCGISNLLMDMIMEPEKVKALEQKTLEMGKKFALAQIEAGANIIGVGDAVCSQISKDMYDEFCLHLQKELFDFIHEHGAIVKLHICGNITHLLPSLKETGVDILDVDWMVDMKEAYRIMGEEIMLCGNLDPVAVIMSGTKEEIKNKYEEIEKCFPRENWIMMGGCEIPRDTPVENMKYLRKISIND